MQTTVNPDPVPCQEIGTFPLCAQGLRHDHLTICIPSDINVQTGKDDSMYDTSCVKKVQQA